MKPYFITTAIDYPNAEPHVGTAFEKIGADAQARFQKQAFGRKPFLLMGNDENTQKVAKAAGHEKPLLYANRMAANFKNTWRLLDVAYDRFGQTTDVEHRLFCSKFIQRVYENGYIFSKMYEGLYCPECEEFKLTVVDGKCPTHNIMLNHHSERNYFFSLSQFKEDLLDLYRTGQIRIEPEFRQLEMVNFIEKELKDISISRCSQGWGIPIPWDDSQVVYVWFDALLNYLTFADGNWPADCHVIGKDIVRFHGAMFPAMIMAYNKYHDDKLALPHTIFSHGFVYAKTDAGLTKFSKSGLSLNPRTLVDVFGSDGYRYFFLKSCNFADDGEYSFGQMAETYNADLVNKYGNLFSRVCRLAVQKLGGKIPGAYLDFPPDALNRATYQWREAMGNFEYRNALTIVMSLIDKENKELDDKKPWADDAADVPGTLAQAARVLKAISYFFAPVMPKSSLVVWNTLQYEGDPGLDQIDFAGFMSYLHRATPLTVDESRLQDGKVPILFPRYKG